MPMPLMPVAEALQRVLADARGLARFDFAFKRMAGGVMPAGADTVVIQELTAREGDTVTIQKATAKHRNVRDRGIDFTQGQTLLRKGRRLSDRDLMLAAAMNYPTLNVHRRPKV